MPSGAARELLALDQDYIGYSALCQVIGNAAANNAAANNHYFGATWQIRHNGPLGGFGGDISVTYYDIQIYIRHRRASAISAKVGKLTREIGRV